MVFQFQFQFCNSFAVAVVRRFNSSSAVPSVAPNIPPAHHIRPADLHTRGHSVRCHTLLHFPSEFILQNVCVYVSVSLWFSITFRVNKVLQIYCRISHFVFRNRLVKDNLNLYWLFEKQQNHTIYIFVILLWMIIIMIITTQRATAEILWFSNYSEFQENLQ